MSDSPSFSAEKSAATLRIFNKKIDDLIKLLRANAKKNYFYIKRTTIHDIRSVKAFVEYVCPEKSKAANSELNIETYSNLDSHNRIICQLETYQKMLEDSRRPPTRNLLTKRSALRNLYQEQPGKCGICQKDFDLSLPQLLVLCSLCSQPIHIICATRQIVHKVTNARSVWKCCYCNLEVVKKEEIEKLENIVLPNELEDASTINDAEFQTRLGTTMDHSPFPAILPFVYENPPSRNTSHLPNDVPVCQKCKNLSVIPCKFDGREYCHDCLLTCYSAMSELQPKDVVAKFVNSVLFDAPLYKRCLNEGYLKLRSLPDETPQEEEDLTLEKEYRQFRQFIADNNIELPEPDLNADDDKITMSQRFGLLYYGSEKEKSDPEKMAAIIKILNSYEELEEGATYEPMWKQVLQILGKDKFERIYDVTIEKPNA